MLFWVIHFNATRWYAKFMFPGCFFVTTTFLWGGLGFRVFVSFSSSSTCVSLLARTLFGLRKWRCWLFKGKEGRGCSCARCKWWTWWGMWRCVTETFPTLVRFSSDVTFEARRRDVMRCVVRMTWHRGFSRFLMRRRGGWCNTTIITQIVVQRQRFKTCHRF